MRKNRLLTLVAATPALLAFLLFLQFAISNNQARQLSNVPVMEADERSLSAQELYPSGGLDNSASNTESANLWERDYLISSASESYISNSRVFINPSEIRTPSPVQVIVPQIIEEPELAPISRDLEYIGSMTRNGEQSYSFKSPELEAAGVFTPGSQWRGWTLIEVTDNWFIFNRNYSSYRISRERR